MAMKLSADPQIYFMDVSFLEDDAVFQENFEKLSEYRRQKTEKIKNRKGRDLCAGAGLLLEEGLKQYGLHEKDMRYDLNEYGKPHFKDHPEIRFSLSHSETKVMACFSRAEIGCDIQKIANVNLRIAERYFCENEKAAILNKRLPEERLEAFFRYWTLKESYVKALGRGMKIPFSSFEIELSEGGAVLKRSENEAGYNFREFEIFPGYRSAVCSPADLDNVKITVLKGGE